jgi:C1A family cysteine protease
MCAAIRVPARPRRYCTTFARRPTLTPAFCRASDSDCGSCWAHAATSSLSDRLLIACKGQCQQLNLAPQYLLNCGNDSKIGHDVGSCHGGSAIRSFEYIHKHGIVDETCCPYGSQKSLCRVQVRDLHPRHDLQELRSLRLLGGA